MSSILKNGLDNDRLLQEWRWLIPEGEVKFVTPLGDLVLQIKAQYWFLDASIGSLEPLAASEDELVAELARRENVVFAKGFVEKMAREGLQLAPGQCIAFKRPIVLGGEYARANAFAVDAYECVGLLGDLNRQIKDLPDQAKVQLKWVE